MGHSIQEVRQASAALVAALEKRLEDRLRVKRDLEEEAHQISVKLSDVKAEIGEVRRELAKQRGEHQPVTESGRTSNAEARKLREEWGRLIYERLAKKPGEEHSRYLLEDVIPEDQRRYWQRVVDQWNRLHKDTPIQYNTGKTASRRYFVSRPKRA